jgi:Asp-tRNA(Asn)/Glu-tRNA(Gln) amidotransferase C subunit
MDEQALLQLFLLGRLEPQPGEKEKLQQELNGILQFVAGVQKAATTLPGEPNAGEVRNVLRADTTTHEPGSFTEAIAAQFPDRDGAFLAVHQVITGGKHSE